MSREDWDCCNCDSNSNGEKLFYEKIKNNIE